MWYRLIVVSALALSCVGCGAWEHKSTPNAEGPNGVFRNAGLHELSQREYRLDPLDEVLIKSPTIKETHEQRYVVNNSGEIVIEGLKQPRVKVSGLSPDEAVAELKKRLSDIYQRPELTIDVTAKSKFYYVFGLGTDKANKFGHTGRITVVSALAEAGFNISAWPQQVRVSRPARDGHANATAVIDFSKIWDQGDLTQNYLVEEGDIIFVPVTPLAHFGIVTGQALAPLTNAASFVTTTGSFVRAGR